MILTPAQIHDEDSLASPLAPPSQADWVSAGYAVLDSQGRVLDSNEDLQKWLELDPVQIRSLVFWDLLISRFPHWRLKLEPVRTTGDRFFAAELPLGESGGSNPGWYRLELVRHELGASVRIASTVPPSHVVQEYAAGSAVQGVGESREVLVRLMRAESRLDNLTQRWPGVIFSQRADFSFLFISPRISAFTGVPADAWLTDTQAFWHVIHEADVEEVRRQVKLSQTSTGGITSTFRIRNVQTGRVSYVLEHRQALVSRSGLVLGYEGMWLDVTRQTIAEKRLSSAAWKETLAVVTMGLAHDFSNIMAGIHSLSESFICQLTPEHPFREGLSLIRHNSMQASQLVQRITQLHHGKTGETNYYDLNQVVGELVELVRKIVPRRIQFGASLSSAALPIFIDPVELRQVILNLVLNAVDAMATGGTLELRTARVTAAPGAKLLCGAAPRLPALALSVQDSGCGIPEKILAHVFDPFFTTKASNKGSGLGLYNSRLFAERFHGGISVETQEGKGTTFTIWLPEADFTEADRSEEGPTSGPGPRPSLVVAGSSAHLLDATVELLRSNGCHAVAARGIAALEECLISPEYRFSALYLILEPASHSGRAFVDAARRSNPNLRLILHLIGLNRDELDERLAQEAACILDASVPEPKLIEVVKGVLEPS